MKKVYIYAQTDRNLNNEGLNFLLELIVDFEKCKWVLKSDGDVKDEEARHVSKMFEENIQKFAAM